MVLQKMCLPSLKYGYKPTCARVITSPTDLHSLVTYVCLVFALPYPAASATMKSDARMPLLKAKVTNKRGWVCNKTHHTYAWPLWALCHVGLCHATLGTQYPAPVLATMYTFFCYWDHIYVLQVRCIYTVHFYKHRLLKMISFLVQAYALGPHKPQLTDESKHAFLGPQSCCSLAFSRTKQLETLELFPLSANEHIPLNPR